MSVSEAELRRAVSVLDAYRAQFDALQKQQEILALSLEEMMRARETMARYKQAGKGAEILVPVGGNAFLFGQIANADRAVIGIGSDVLVEEPIPAALERIDGRIKQVQEAVGGLGQRIADLDARVQAQSEFVQGVYEKLSGEPEEPAPAKKPSD
ncbi:MAG TPA: prefoldin subunit alpha [Thermoplasmata archaeon]|nr:prefoldin subunit alpha [Thermoplasmata archaeon]